uniref:Uncharacterized protein n=1 Tax=Tetradesmus obliquus TaxID=3088 RepID=A0A383VXL0_TETOB|eukprot:jgi/Sobl393_1/2317/SZX69599.1
MLYSSAVRQLAVAHGRAQSVGSRAAAAAVAAAVARPGAAAATPVLQAFASGGSSSSNSNIIGSSASRRHPRRLAASYSSDALAEPTPDASSSNGAPPGQTPAYTPVVAFESNPAAAMPMPAAGQQPEQTQSMQQPPAQVQAGGPGQAVPGQLGQMQPGQMQPGQMQPGQMQPGQMQPGQMQQAQLQPGQLQSGQMQPAQLQPGQLQPGQMQQAQMQPGQMQPGQMQPGQMQPGQMQPGQMQPGQMQPGQMQPGQMQPAQMQPGQLQPAQMQAPLQQQQGVPMQFAPQQQQQGMPGQPYMQAAAGQQPTYMQQAPAFPMGQPLAPGMQAPAMGQMPAASQAYMQQGPGYDMAQMQGYTTQSPAAGQMPAGVLQAAAPAAAQAQSEPTVTHFQEDWVNIVGLTGVVLQGPFLQQFGTGKVKASMVLGVLARATGDAMADAPRPILVEAWGERAYTLAQQVKAGALLSVLGHLALDMRPQESTPSHGPALRVLLDSWELVTPATVPSDRPACAYKGEYNGVLQMISGGARAGQQQGQWQQGGGGQQQQQGRQKPAINKQQVMQMFMQGMRIYDIAQSLNGSSSDVFAALVEVAEEQGAASAAWAPLLAAADLAAPGKAVAYYNAVAQAVQQNTESLTKAGHVRMKVVRAFLLSPQCQLSQEVQQQESSTGGVNKTYSQIRLLLAMIRVGIRP